MAQPEVDLFCFERVSVSVDGATLLDEVDVRIRSVGLTAIVGPSGSGKSTLLRLCNRLEVPSSGRVRYRGDDVAGLDPLALRRRVGMVFQRPTLFPGTVGDNLDVAVPGISGADARTSLELAALDATFLDRTADDLSGGEAQRVCLARTLATSPEVLLMDEPTSALDEENTLVLERLGRELAVAGVPVLWVTHDPGQVERIADRLVVLAEGRVVPDEGDGRAG